MDTRACCFVSLGGNVFFHLRSLSSRRLPFERSLKCTDIHSRVYIVNMRYGETKIQRYTEGNRKKDRNTTSTKKHASITPDIPLAKKHVQTRSAGRSPSSRRLPLQTSLRCTDIRSRVDIVSMSYAETNIHRYTVGNKKKHRNTTSTKKHASITRDIPLAKRHVQTRSAGR